MLLNLVSVEAVVIRHLLTFSPLSRLVTAAVYTNSPTRVMSVNVN